MLENILTDMNVININKKKVLNNWTNNNLENFERR